MVETIPNEKIVVEDLLNDALSTHLVSRLNITTARHLIVTQDSLDHIIYMVACHILEELRHCKVDKSSKLWTLLVMWIGLVGW